jgi:hypothetical protein
VCASAENWTEYLHHGVFGLTVQDNFIDSRKPGNPFESKLRVNQYTIDYQKTTILSYYFDVNLYEDHSNFIYFDQSS